MPEMRNRVPPGRPQPVSRRAGFGAALLFSAGIALIGGLLALMFGHHLPTGFRDGLRQMGDNAGSAITRAFASAPNETAREAASNNSLKAIAATHRLPSDPGRDATWRAVRHVVDGAHLVLDGGYRVRLLGIEAPERQAGPRQDAAAATAGVSAREVRSAGDRAGAFALSLVEDQAVRLSFDGFGENREGVAMALVWLEDGRLLNQEMVREGFAVVRPDAAFSLRDDFLTLEREARRLRRGLHANRTMYVNF